MVDSNTRSRSTTSTRRQYLMSAAAGAVGLTGVGIAGANSSRRTIPFVKDGDDVVKTKSVPADWYDQSKQARNAASQAKNSLVNHPAVESVGVGTSDTHVSGLREQTVEVVLKEDADDRHPSQIGSGARR